MTAFEALLDALDRELRDYRELHGISREKGPCIVRGDMRALTEMVEAELECLARIERAEAARQAAADELAVEHDLPPGNTLQDILPRLSEAERKELVERRHALLSVMDEVRRLNAANEALLAQSLAYVQFSLELLQRAGAGADLYDRDGRRPATAGGHWQRRA